MVQTATHHDLESALARAKQRTWAMLGATATAGSSVPALHQVLQQTLAPDAAWHLSHPINELVGPQQVLERFVAPLHASFPDLERRTDLFFAGWWDGTPDLGPGGNPPGGGRGFWCSTTGHYLGTFRAPWCGIPATGEPAALRFGEFYRWDPQSDQLVEARILLDVVDLARQAGRPLLPRASGLELLVPGPAGHDGLLLDATDPTQGQESMRCVMAMIAGLMQFDGRDLATMGMERFWHPQMMWYGPGGIGTNRGVSGFQRHHQRPFLHAFPDRKGAGHRARIAEGSFVASTGWPSVRATHRGDYLGVPASGQPIGMRVMDWWRREGALLRENWVLIDLPHLMLQMGVDLMERLTEPPRQA